MREAVGQVQEEGQAPALRRVAGLCVQFRDVVGQLPFGRVDGRARVFGHVGDLVGEHEVHSFFLQDAGAGRGVDAVVEQHGDDLGVLVWTCEQAGTALLEDRGALGVGGGDECGPCWLAVWCEGDFASV